MSPLADQRWSIALELGAELKAARVQAKKTQSDVNLALLGSRDRINRIESGRGPFKWEHVQALCDLYGVPKRRSALMIEMAKATQEKGDWLETSPKRFGLYLMMEKRATRVTAVTLDVIHGLLQTPRYHEALQAGWYFASPEDALPELKQRQERQASFWGRGDAHLEVVMWEAALRRMVGSDELMTEQLHHLRHLARREGVSIRYIPLNFATAPSLPGAFSLITTELGESVYTEHLDGGRILSDPDVVAQARSIASLALKASRDIGEWQ